MAFHEHIMAGVIFVRSVFRTIAPPAVLIQADVVRMQTKRFC